MIDNTYDVLLIDDDPDILTAYQDLLGQEGYRVLAAADPTQILCRIPPDWAGVVLCDVMLPQISGLTLLAEIMRFDHQLPVIMITGHGDVPMAVEAVKMGAIDFLEKPVAAENLLKLVQESLHYRRRLVAQRQSQLNKLNQKFIGNSDWITSLKNRLQKLADSRLPVFLWGEPGSGRHLSAVNLHQLSSQQDNAFICYECTQQNPTPLEQLLAESQDGTLVLKHCHWLTVAQQQRLATALHHEPHPIRFIAISDMPLAELIRQHHLSAELYSLFIHTQIELLPLHKHPTDIAAIFLHYVQKSCLQLHKTYSEPPKKLLQHLATQQWQGNVTELISVAELYAIGLFAETTATTLAATQIKTEDINPLERQINQYEKQIIEDALIFFQGRINNVANYLDIPRKKLYLRMQKYGIDKKEYKF